MNIKKNGFKNFILGTIFVLFALTSCEQEDENTSGIGLFIPPANMTQEQIIDLLEDALKATKASNEISYTLNDTTNNYYMINEEEYLYRNFQYSINIKNAVNTKTRKALQINQGCVSSLLYIWDKNTKEHDLLDSAFQYKGYSYYYFHFFEEDNAYWKDNNTLYKSIGNNYLWSHYNMIHQDFFELNCHKYKWKIDKEQFIGSYELESTIPESPPVTCELTIILTKNKKIHEFDLRKISEVAGFADKMILSKKNCTCSYIATPNLPDGYSKSDFIPSDI